VDDVGVDVDVGDRVRQHPDVRADVDDLVAPQRLRPTVVHDVVAVAGDLAVPLEVHLGVAHLPGPGRAGAEDLPAAQHEVHRLAELHREHRRDHLVREHLRLGAEAGADLGDHHAHAVARDLQRVGEDVAHRLRAPGRLVDEAAVDAVALRAPAVLGHDGARGAGQPRVERAVADETAHQAAVEGRDGERIVEPGAAVGHAQLQGRVLQGGPDHPPDIAGILDGAGRHQGVDVALVVGRVLEQVRQAGAG
jgi:hypothetical protein